MITVAATGFFTAFSLILAIGAQNAFVLRQGLLKQHVFVLCLLCAVSDAILITLGVSGFGWLVTLNPKFPVFLSIGGAVFLIIYGAIRFKAAFVGQSSQQEGSKKEGFWPVILTGQALTWLNPHVYLDTLGLIGAISAQYTLFEEKLVFAVFASSASFAFFFSLGYGARLLAPVMQTQKAWRVLDAIIGAVMWIIAVGLITPFI